MWVLLAPFFTRFESNWEGLAINKRKIKEIRVYAKKYKGFEEGAAKALGSGGLTWLPALYPAVNL